MKLAWCILGLLWGLVACGELEHVTAIEGEKGEQGEVGEDGDNGHSSLIITIDVPNSCSNNGKTLLMGLDRNDNGILDSRDTNFKSVEICNGLDGVDGIDGIDGSTSPFLPVAVIDPCGDEPNILDEVLLQLSNGSILASVSDKANGQNTRFSFLVPGTYKTTDGSNCAFTLSNGLISY